MKKFIEDISFAIRYNSYSKFVFYIDHKYSFLVLNKKIKFIIHCLKTSYSFL